MWTLWVDAEVKERAMAGDEWQRPGHEDRGRQRPDEELAGRIAARLAEAGLILPRDGRDVRDQVAAGRARRDDWVAWIGRALEAPPGWDGEAYGADR
jgi:hypothetical protein